MENKQLPPQSQCRGGSCLATNYLYIGDAFYILGEVIETIDEVKQITQ
ncbi:hypothetical protein H6G96_13410 [Nostoc sp. FACHB-892]|nr:hypothetical protein [Nostoc sp. FACHB-892]MBD2727297.1 hypothetical protein [Nostoc sp. FACHB-892]